MKYLTTPLEPFIRPQVIRQATGRRDPDLPPVERTPSPGILKANLKIYSTPAE